MVECCLHNQKRENSILAVNRVLQYDPTRTLSTRKRFIAEIERRFKLLKKAITEYIVEGGLLKDNFLFTLSNKEYIINVDWVSKYDPDKIPQFNRWLERMNEKFILSGGVKGIEVVSRPGTQWTDKYIRSAYQKGIARGRAELRKAGIKSIPELEHQIGGLSGLFNEPIHSERVKLAFTQTYEGMVGVTKGMSSSFSHIVASGMAEGRSPKEIARTITATVDKKGLTNAKMVARTEVIRAHHKANIAEYRAAGIQGVTVKAEWSTAGFNVCPICSGNEGRQFTLQQIEGLLPVHPNCRCVALPIVEE